MIDLSQIEYLRREIRAWMEKNRDTLPIGELEKGNELLDRLDELLADQSARTRSNWVPRIAQFIRLIVMYLTNDAE